MIVAGPDATDDKMWVSPQDGPLFLKDVVDDVAKTHPIDGRRMYLFGHSAGANFALQMAMLESEFFAAAAIHAGAVSSDYYSVFDAATRKIPMAICIGTRDQFYPIDVVRGVHEALEKRGIRPALTRRCPTTTTTTRRSPRRSTRRSGTSSRGIRCPRIRGTRVTRTPDPLAAANLSRRPACPPCPPPRPVGQ